MSSDDPILIPTQWGPVSEGARRQAAENMKNDPFLRERIIAMIGEAEARRRYPEAGWDDAK